MIESACAGPNDSKRADAPSEEIPVRRNGDSVGR